MNPSQNPKNKVTLKYALLTDTSLILRDSCLKISELLKNKYDVEAECCFTSDIDFVVVKLGDHKKFKESLKSFNETLFTMYTKYCKNIYFAYKNHQSGLQLYRVSISDGMIKALAGSSHVVSEEIRQIIKNKENLSDISCTITGEGQTTSIQYLQCNSTSAANIIYDNSLSTTTIGTILQSSLRVNSTAGPQFSGGLSHEKDKPVLDRRLLLF